MKLDTIILIRKHRILFGNWSWQGFISEVDFYSVRERWDAMDEETICIKIRKLLVGKVRENA